MTKQTKDITLITIAVIIAGLFFKWIIQVFQPDPLFYLIVPIGLFISYPFILRYVYKHRSMPTPEDIELAKKGTKEWEGHIHSYDIRSLVLYMSGRLIIFGYLAIIIGLLLLLGIFFNKGKVIEGDMSIYWQFILGYGVILVSLYWLVNLLRIKFGLSRWYVFLAQGLIILSAYISFAVVMAWLTAS